jgi:radical SAM superfamily enzyme YgiQ (UPF0313 family)
VERYFQVKLLLVSPPFGEKGQMSKGLPIAPPVLEYLAGFTHKVRPDIKIKLIDANKERFDPEDLDADLIGFTVLTPQAPWVYKMADKLRSMGKKIILGGIHVSALPDEAKQHADSIVVGEAESIWEGLLGNFENNSLKPVYYGEQLPLNNLPRPITNLWKTKYVYGYFQTSRGCHFRCTFCSVHKFYGGEVRVRPIKDVVEEVADSKWRLFWGIDDNIWGEDINYTIELYREMSRNIKGKWWFGSGDLISVQHSRSDELLKYARMAGLTAVLVGWESNNLESLREYRAVSKQGRQRRDGVKRIRDHGIDVMLFIMVGGRQDIREDFDGILKLCDELKVSAHPVMTTPFPGTELYEMYKPYLIPDLEWDSFDGNHAVFEHPTMSPEEREGTLIELRARIFTVTKIIQRMLQVSWRGFPMSHITSWMIQYPQGRAFKEYAWQKKKHGVHFI